jgi:hypothetical protein
MGRGYVTDKKERRTYTREKRKTDLAGRGLEIF